MQELLGIHSSNIDKTRIQPDPADILNLLGEQEEVNDEHTMDLVQHYTSECLRLSSPEGAFLITEALETDSPGTLCSAGISFESGKIIQKMLRHSEYYALFLVTAGPGAETLARSFYRRETTWKAISWTCLPPSLWIWRRTRWKSRSGS